MKNCNSQLKIEYSETDDQPKSVKLMCVFLVLIFALVPLVEIVPNFEYNIVSSFNPTTYTCLTGWESFEPLSFKEIK